jgi:ribosomal protein S12 methylthiotransferase
VDDVIPLMAAGKILPYLDIPFQHAHPDVLRAMKRPADQTKVLERIRKWREVCPDLAIRSTFIVGFPGETEEQFEYLLDWMEEAEIDRAGAFKYENVRGAASNDLPGQVDEEVKEERWQRLMETQMEISRRRLAVKIGQTVEAIVDEVDDEGAVVRTKWDAPEVDGALFIDSEDATKLKPGDIVRVEIDEADETDLWGTLVG